MRHAYDNQPMEDTTQMERVTVTLTHDQVRMLKSVSSKNKVAVAWLVRLAVDRFLQGGENVQLPFDFRRVS